MTTFRTGLKLLTRVLAFALPLLAATVVLNGCSSGTNVVPPPIEEPGLTLLRCGVEEINAEMHVRWVANHPTSGEIRFGETAFTQLIRVSALADSHDIVLTGLHFNTNHIYEIRIVDQELNTAECSGNFRTPQKARPEPVISGFEITEITETSARFTWRTDEPATTELIYGLGALTDTASQPDFVFVHDLRLSNLTPSSLHLVRPEAVDTTALRGIGPDSSFTTAARLTLWFDDATVALGDTADLQVHIAAATDLAALQYQLTFTTGRIEVVDLVEGDFYSDHNGFAFFRGIRNSRGEVTNHMTWSIEYNGATRIGTAADGGGIVATLRVRGLDTGNANMQFAADSTFGLDMFAQARTCSLRVGQITVTD